MLNTLSAPGNVLTEVPEALGRLTALQQLVLSGNQLTALPSGISALGARCPCLDQEEEEVLRQLVLSGNQLTALPSGISALGARYPCLDEEEEEVLRQLVLSGNQLTALPSGISALGARYPCLDEEEEEVLLQLVLSANQLTALPSGISALGAALTLFRTRRRRSSPAAGAVPQPADGPAIGHQRPGCALLLSKALFWKGCTGWRRLPACCRQRRTT